MTRWAELSAALLARPRSAPHPHHTPRARTAALLARLGDPQRTVPAIHVAGTNGKSSTARIADALLRATGRSTAAFTSPHLRALAERITLTGTPASDAELEQAWERLAPALAATERELGPLAFFDVVCALAFVVIAEARPDAMVIEVGMGGSDDATNVLDAATAAITPVGLDHLEALGGSLEAIARHKAGIIGRGAQVILGPQEAPVRAILAAAAAGIGATVIPRGRILTRHPEPTGQELELELGGIPHAGLYLPLLGAHQADNALTAIAAVEAHLGRRLSLAELRSGLAQARVPGRLEVVSGSPLTLLDVTHNPAGMVVTAAALAEAFTDRPRPVAVFAAARNKDAHGMLDALTPVVSAVVLTGWGPEAREPASLTHLTELTTSVIPDPVAALATAREIARSGVVITGSHRLAGVLS